MTESYFPFDAGAGGNVLEAEWAKMARLWAPTGVVGDVSDRLAVSAGTGLAVEVAAGAAWIRGHYYETDAPLELAIAAADVTNPRIDRVVARLDRSGNVIEVDVLTGVPAVDGTQVAPGLTQTTLTWEISLAQVAIPAGAATVGTITDERTFGPALSSPTFDVRTYGAIGDGVADDTAPLRAAAAAAAAVNGVLYVPAQVNLRITDTVDLVGVRFVRSEGTITVDYLGGPGVLAGSNSASTVPVSLLFRSVVHAAGVDQAVPALRLRGLKNAEVSVHRCHYLQLWADHATATATSIAYSTFWLTGDINHLELFGTAGGTSWINENTFYGGRIHHLEINGEYGHNHNLFYHLKMEGATGVIDLNVGHSNLFHGVRAEGNSVVNFGPDTHSNRLLSTWQSIAYNRAGGLVVGTDEGISNVVASMHNLNTFPVEIARIDRATVAVDGAQEIVNRQDPPWPATVGWQTIVPSIGPKVEAWSAWRRMIDTGLIPLAYMPTSRERAAVIDRLEIEGSDTRFRPRVAFYDADRQPLDEGVVGVMISKIGGWVWEPPTATVPGHYKVGSDQHHLRVTPTPAGRAAATYVRVTVDMGNPADRTFTHVGVRAYVPISAAPALADFARRQTHGPLAQAAAPTKGARFPGTFVGNTAGGGWVCIDRRDTLLAGAEAAAETVLTLDDATGIAVDDVIGVELDTGLTHWTTVTAVAAPDVTIATGLPSGSAADRRVVTNRWEPIPDQDAIDAAIAALVDSSPAALDTLNELAAALGDDPNFATTVNNAIAAVQTDVDDHLADATDAHDASAISYDGTASGLTATDAQAAIDELDADLDTHVAAVGAGAHVDQQAAIADLALVVSDPPTQAETQAIADKVDAILAALRAGGTIAT